MCACVRGCVRVLFMRFSYKHVFSCAASIDLVFINDTNSGFYAVSTSSLTTTRVNFAFRGLKEYYFLLFRQIYVPCLPETSFVPNKLLWFPHTNQILVKHLCQEVCSMKSAVTLSLRI